MRQGLLHSVAPILAAPWRQRRNLGSLWGVWLVIGCMALAPVGLLLWSVGTLMFGSSITAQTAQMATDLRHAAMNAMLWALGALLLAGWGVTVSNLLDQNRPVLARLVPEHPARLRAALLVAWVAMVALITLLVGVRLDAPLACAAAVAPGLALMAASLRFPALWFLGAMAPVVVHNAMQGTAFDSAIETVIGAWLAQPVAILLALVAGAAVALMGLIQSGGKRHVASDAARRNRAERFRMRARGGQPVVEGKRGLLDAVLTRPYYAFWRFTFQRPSAPMFTRLMLALGPGAHWTAGFSTVMFSALALAIGLLLLEAVGLVFPPAAHIAPQALAGVTTGLLIGVLSPALQIQARLHQSRREQALLTLLPGAPRGAALNRRLAGRLTAQFLTAWVGGLLLTMVCMAVAGWLHADGMRQDLLGFRNVAAVATLPLVVFQWRPWSRVAAPSALNALGPVLLGGGIAVLAFVGPFTGWFSLTAVATTTMGVAVAWCALRWGRMGGEPSALPMGRLAT